MAKDKAVDTAAAEPAPFPEAAEVLAAAQGVAPAPTAGLDSTVSNPAAVSVPQIKKSNVETINGLTITTF
jgi:hypothetical protein